MPTSRATTAAAITHRRRSQSSLRIRMRSIRPYRSRLLLSQRLAEPVLSSLFPPLKETALRNRFLDEMDRSADQRLLVITPVRNEAAHIERVVAAMAAQTRPPEEWLVVDDGSDDGTDDLLRSLAPGVPFMRVVSAPAETAPSGVARLALAAAPRAFNFGLTQSSGGFTHVAKLDGDVELPPQYYEVLLA